MGEIRYKGTGNKDKKNDAASYVGRRDRGADGAH